jgi:hypothetical protein
MALPVRLRRTTTTDMPQSLSLLIMPTMIKQWYGCRTGRTEIWSLFIDSLLISLDSGQAYGNVLMESMTRGNHAKYQYFLYTH